MSNSSLPVGAGQDEFDELFESITEAEACLDDVIVKLAAVGVPVPSGQRLVVAEWLELFPIDTPIPLAHRLAALHGMLAA